MVRPSDTSCGVGLCLRGQAGQGLEDEIEAPVEVERDLSGFGMKKGTTITEDRV